MDGKPNPRNKAVLSNFHQRSHRNKLFKINLESRHLVLSPMSIQMKPAADNRTVLFHITPLQVVQTYVVC